MRNEMEKGEPKVSPLYEWLLLRKPFSGQVSPLVFQHLIKELFSVRRSDTGQLRIIQEGGQTQLPVTAEGGCQRVFLV